ncbi:hypothetical protein WJX73_007966 [Symbiochloris irregularis]|uniref:Peptidase S59 domain-containing protein n=1 Tax=Symbiochloris irregularis TaxID=706552 RepID=A0AAW1PEW2_9CHLO
MSFGSFGFGASQASQPAFGAGSSSPFGQTAAPFGQQQPATAFGTPQTGGGVFGASSTPAFGGFGASSGASGFGATSNPFGAKPASSPFGGAGFGSPTPAPAPFGASQPAFGQASSSAFGFGGTPSFGGASNAFGASQTPTFGAAASQPAFGAPSSAPAFGASTSTFGAPGSGFGAQGGFGGGFGQQNMSAPTGTRTPGFQRVAVSEPGGANQKGPSQPCYYMTITAQDPYKNKSLEELRWEDYQNGDKGNPNAGASQPGAFGATTAFGASQPASPFGGSPASPFGSAQSSPAMGFGTQQAGAFGGQSSAAFTFQSSSPAGWGTSGQTPAFGATSAPAFGAQPSNPFGANTGGAFGFNKPATSAPSLFGQSSASAFGQSTPSFGGFGTPQASSTPASPFGGTSGFGGGAMFGQSSAAAASPFGGTGFGNTQPSSAGAFSFGTPGQSQPQTGAFGGFNLGQSNASGFGAGTTSGFSFASSPAPSTGAGLFSGFNQPASGTSLFGQQQQGASPGFGVSSPSLFGTPNTNMFGMPQSQPGAGFGGSSLFGTPQQQQPLQQQQQQMGAVAMPSVGVNPYGMLPQPVPVGGGTSDALAELRTGLSSRPLAPLSGSRTLPRTPALFGPRTMSHGLSSGRMRARPPSRLSDVTLFGSAPSSGNLDSSPSKSTTTTFTPRANPREFFLRDPLPSTEAATTNAATTHAAEGSAAPSSSSREGGSGGEGGAGPSRNTTADEVDPQAAGRSDSGGGLSDANARSGKDRRLSDAEVSKVLPKLTKRDYTTEPRLEQLAPMAREDPLLLSRVNNFVVAHKGVGRIRWLQPVDVRGLDLDAIVRLDPGIVEVYLEGSSRASVGEGLNKPAEVTLYGVYKKNKATGQPVTDPEDIEAYRKRLKRLAAGQKSRFVSYEPQGGVWCFEVDHFSRYGLIDNDSDTDEDAAPVPQREAADSDSPHSRVKRRKSPRSTLLRTPGRAGGRTPMSEGEEGDTDGSGMSEGEGQEPVDARKGQPRQPLGSSRVTSPKSSPAHHPFGDTAAMHDDNGIADEEDADEDDDTLVELVGRDRADAMRSDDVIVKMAAQGGVDPREMLDMQAALFPQRAQQTRFRRPMRPRPSAFPAAFTQRGSQAPTAPPRAPAAAAKTPPSVRGLVGPDEDDLEAEGMDVRGPKRGLGATAWVSAQAAPILPPSTPDFGMTAPVPVSDRSPPAIVAGRGWSGLRMPQGETEDRCITQAGLCMGRSCRVGWSPFGFYAHAGMLPDSTPPATARLPKAFGTGIIITHTGAHNPLSPPEALTQLCKQQLELQLQHSEMVGPSTSDKGVPMWRLKCSREHELKALCDSMRQLCTSTADQGGLLPAAKACLEHEAWAWQLVDALFSHIPSSVTVPQAQGTANSEAEVLDEDESQEDVVPAAAEAAATDAALDAAQAMHDDVNGDDVIQGDSADSEQQLRAFRRRRDLVKWLQERGAGPAMKAARGTRSVMLRVAHLLAAGCCTAAAELAARAGNVRLAALIQQGGRCAWARQCARQQVQDWTSQRFLDHINPDTVLVYRLIAGQLDDVIPELDLDWHRAFNLHLWFEGEEQPPTFAAAMSAYSRSVEAGFAPPPTPHYLSLSPSSASSDSKPAAQDICFSLLQLHATQQGGDTVSEGAFMEGCLAAASMTPHKAEGLVQWRLLCILQAIGALDSATGRQQVSKLIAAVVEQLLGTPALSLQEEFEQRMAAEQYSKAHHVLAAVLAPAWLHERNWGKLREALALLQPHAASVHSHEGGLSYATGAGLYELYLMLQDCATDSKAGPADPAEYERFQQQLQMAQPQYDKLLSTSILPQAALQVMASDVARWWAADVPGAHVLGMPLLLPAARITHVVAAAAALAIQS